MTRNYIDFVTFHFTAQLNGGLLGVDPGAQGSGHILYVILVKIEFGRNLPVRQIQSHQVEAQDPG